jgi:hypothetical protein
MSVHRTEMEPRDPACHVGDVGERLVGFDGGPGRPRPRVSGSCEAAALGRSCGVCVCRFSSAGLAGCPKDTAADSAVARSTSAGVDRDADDERVAPLRQLLLEDEVCRPHPGRDPAGLTGVHGRAGRDGPGTAARSRPRSTRNTHPLLERRTRRHPHGRRPRFERCELRRAASNSLTQYMARRSRLPEVKP